jgi:hypothetical protein
MNSFTLIKKPIDLNTNISENLYKILNKYNYVDAYFYYYNYTVFVKKCFANSFQFFDDPINWFSLHSNYIILYWIDSNSARRIPTRNYYFFLSDSKPTDPIFYIPFNWESNGIIFADNSASTRTANNSTAKIFSVGKKILSKIQFLTDNDAYSDPKPTIVEDSNGIKYGPKFDTDNNSLTPPIKPAELKILKPEKFENVLVFLNTLEDQTLLIGETGTIKLKIKYDKSKTDVFFHVFNEKGDKLIPKLLCEKEDELILEYNEKIAEIKCKNIIHINDKPIEKFKSQYQFVNYYKKLSLPGSTSFASIDLYGYNNKAITKTISVKVETDKEISFNNILVSDYALIGNKIKSRNNEDIFVTYNLELNKEIVINGKTYNEERYPFFHFYDQNLLISSDYKRYINFSNKITSDITLIEIDGENVKEDNYKPNSTLTLRENTYVIVKNYDIKQIRFPDLEINNYVKVINKKPNVKHCKTYFSFEDPSLNEDSSSNLYFGQLDKYNNNYLYLKTINFLELKIFGIQSDNTFQNYDEWAFYITELMDEHISYYNTLIYDKDNLSSGFYCFDLNYINYYSYQFICDYQVNVLINVEKLNFNNKLNLYEFEDVINLQNNYNFKYVTCAINNQSNIDNIVIFLNDTLATNGNINASFYQNLNESNKRL